VLIVAPAFAACPPAVRDRPSPLSEGTVDFARDFRMIRDRRLKIQHGTGSAGERTGGVKHENEGPHATMTTWTDKRVLVADDSQTMRMLILFHLIKTMPGVKIIEAENGLEALEWLEQGDVDLILTDMNMPKMDGAGLIRAVREELKRETPIIIITTRGEQRDRERGMAAGANGYITKPLDVRQFRETVRKFIF
jgi:two-component system, chemotaxis family, chemotaxis protein CheY